MKMSAIKKYAKIYLPVTMLFVFLFSMSAFASDYSSWDSIANDDLGAHSTFVGWAKTGMSYGGIIAVAALIAAALMYMAGASSTIMKSLMMVCFCVAVLFGAPKLVNKIGATVGGLLM